MAKANSNIALREEEGPPCSAGGLERRAARIPNSGGRRRRVKASTMMSTKGVLIK